VVRIASEFVSIADHYARSRHFWRYRVVPTAGASEGFVPEDAELLIEGTETGRTLAENQLKAIDVLFRSTTCVIVGKGAVHGERGELVKALLAKLARGAVAASARM
jgi:ATP phosphoribosyltransferase